MGWAGGSELAEVLWETVRKHVPKKDLKKVAKKWVNAFEDQDCDTMYECEQLMKDADIKLED